MFIFLHPPRPSSIHILFLLTETSRHLHQCTPKERTRLHFPPSVLYSQVCVPCFIAVVETDTLAKDELRHTPRVEYSLRMEEHSRQQDQKLSDYGDSLTLPPLRLGATWSTESHGGISLSQSTCSSVKSSSLALLIHEKEGWCLRGPTTNIVFSNLA